MKKLASLLLVLLAATALVACGGSDDDTSSTPAETTSEAGGQTGGGEAAGGGAAGGGSTVMIDAAEGTDLAYVQKDVKAEAGKVTIEFNNPQSISHDVDVEDSKGEGVGETDLVAEGSATAALDLEPGTNTFFCSVPGHREAGMEGTLTVK
jgi:uncharacterized cupredoxin-like copper-binding protein